MKHEINEIKETVQFFKEGDYMTKLFIIMTAIMFVLSFFVCLGIL